MFKVLNLNGSQEGRLTELHYVILTLYFAPWAHKVVKPIVLRINKDYLKSIRATYLLTSLSATTPTLSMHISHRSYEQ